VAFNGLLLRRCRPLQTLRLTEPATLTAFPKSRISNNQGNCRRKRCKQGTAAILGIVCGRYTVPVSEYQAFTMKQRWSLNLVHVFIPY
jgi:hypothetical protein